jgi:hypothetical protein
MSNPRHGLYRCRTWLRRRLPWVLVDWGVAGKGTTDCGNHEWYNADGVVEHCYHCTVGRRPYDSAHFDASG